MVMLEPFLCFKTEAILWQTAICWHHCPSLPNCWCLSCPHAPAEIVCLLWTVSPLPTLCFSSQPLWWEGVPTQETWALVSQVFLGIIALSFSESTGTCRNLAMVWEGIKRPCWRGVMHTLAQYLELLPILTQAWCLVWPTLSDVFCFYNDFLTDAPDCPPLNTLSLSNNSVHIWSYLVRVRNFFPIGFLSDQVMWLCLYLSVPEYSLTIRRLVSPGHRRFWKVM